jgi:hypothetical protein
MVIETAAEILQGSKVIGEPKRFAPPAKNLPVASTLGGAERALQAIAQILRETVVVQQRVVHVQEKYDFIVVQHGADLSI